MAVKVKNINYFLAPVKVWDSAGRQSVFQVDVLEAGRIGKDLSKFDKGQIVVVRRLGWSISKMASLVESSHYEVVIIY